MRIDATQLVFPDASLEGVQTAEHRSAVDPIGESAYRTTLGAMGDVPESVERVN